MAKNKRIPLKITFEYSQKSIDNIEKLIGEMIGKKLVEDYKREVS